MRIRFFGFSLCLALFFLTTTPESPAMPGKVAQNEVQKQSQVTAQVKSLGKNQEKIVQEEIRVQSLEKDVAILSAIMDARLDAQDQRFSDLEKWTGQQANYMAAISNVTTWVGAGITLIALVAGFVIYFSMKSRASAEAMQAAERWFQQNTNDLRGQIDVLLTRAGNLQSQLDELQQKAKDAHGQIEDQTTAVGDHAKKSVEAISKAAQESRKVIDDAAQQILSLESKDQASQRIVDQASIEVVQQASLALKAKPENEFTSDDHYARGVDEYRRGSLGAALLSFEEAIRKAQQEQVLPEHYVKLMNARAVVIHAQGDTDQAIEIFDEIDRDHGSNTSPGMREQVAKAIFNKGAVLDVRNESEKAIAIYDEVDRRYGRDTSSGVREQVVDALFNKGWILGNGHFNDKAIEVYDEIDRRYGEDASPGIRVAVAKALVCKGIDLGQAGRVEEAINVYEKIENRYSIDTNPSLLELLREARNNKLLLKIQNNP